MDRTLVLVVLLVAVVANVVFIGFALLTLRRRNGRDDVGPAPGGILAVMPGGTGRIPAPGLAADVTAANVSPAVLPATMTIPQRTDTVVAMSERESDMSETPSGAPWSLGSAPEAPGGPAVSGSSRDDGMPAVDPLVDRETGFATALAWEDAFRNEDRRLARYGRPVTVLVAELDGLDALAVRLGRDAADRLIQPVAAALRHEARAADLLARVGHARFSGLMPETDEIAAINYVERVRSACDMWLASGAVAVRLAIGWAQAPAGGRLDSALRLAEDRMNGDRRRLRGIQHAADVHAADVPRAKGVAPIPANVPPAEVAVPPAPDEHPAEVAPSLPSRVPPAEVLASAAASSPTTQLAPPPPPVSAPETPPVVRVPAEAFGRAEPFAGVAAGEGDAPEADRPPAPASASDASGSPTPPASADAPPPARPYVPDGPFPGSNGDLPEPISVIEGERTYY